MGHTPRVLAIDAGGTMTDTFIVDEHRRASSSARRRRRPRTSRSGSWSPPDDALRQWDSTPRGALPARSPPAIYQRHRDAQPAALAQGAATSARSSPPARRTTCGSSAASRPTSATPTPTASTSRPTTTTSRSSRASRVKGVRGPHRRVRAARSLPLREEDAARRRDELLDDGRRGHLRLPALLLPQRRARDRASARSSRRRRRERGAERRRCRVFLSSRALPAAPRPAAAQLDPDRGLRGRALARHPAARCATATKERGRRLRAAGDGLARRHDLDRGDASWRRTLVSGPIGGVVGGQALAERHRRCRTCSAPTSAARRSTSR